jgi:hypothetical protein
MEEFGFLKQANSKKYSNPTLSFLKKVCQISNLEKNAFLEEKTTVLPLNSIFYLVIGSENVAQTFSDLNESKTENCGCHSKTIMIVDDGDAAIILCLCCKINVFWMKNNEKSNKQNKVNVEPLSSIKNERLGESFFAATETISTLDQTNDILALLNLKKMNTGAENAGKRKESRKVKNDAIAHTFFSQVQKMEIEWYFRPSATSYDDDDDDEAHFETALLMNESSHEMKLLEKYLNDPDLNTSKTDLDKIILKSNNNSNSLREENEEEYESNPLKTTMSFSHLINDDIWTRDSIMKYGGLPLWVHDNDTYPENKCTVCSKTQKNRFVFQLLPSLWQKFPKDFIPWTVDWSSIFIFQCQECNSYFSFIQSI